MLARTLNNERAVVRVTNGEAVIEAGIVTKTKLPATTLSEESFFERLHASSPETAATFRAFLPKVSDLGIFLQPASKSATLRWESPDGNVFSLGAVDCDGRLGTYSVCWTPRETGQLKLAHEYLRDLAVLADAKVRETKDPAQWYLSSDSLGSGLKPPPALPLLKRGAEWVELMTRYQAKLSAAESIR